MHSVLVTIVAIMFSNFIVVPGENTYGNLPLFTACWDALHLYYKLGCWNEDNKCHLSEIH